MKRTSSQPSRKRSGRRGGHRPPGTSKRSPAAFVTAYFQRHIDTFFDTLRRMLRQPFATAMTVAVIGIALALPAGLQVLVINAKSVAGRWESVADLSVYLKRELPESAALELAADLRERDDIAAVVWVSPDRALEEFSRATGFGAAMEALSDNPLPGALIVRPADADATTVATLASFLRTLPQADIVQSDTQWVNRLNGILEVVRRGLVVASAMLALAVLVIIGNTIRLDIQNRRAEIEIVKLIGASNGFIRRPFLYAGACYGFAGGATAMVLIYAVLWLLRGPVARVAGLYQDGFFLSGPDLPAVGLLLGGGTLLGWLGSFIAASRHMAATEPE